MISFCSFLEEILSCHSVRQVLFIFLFSNKTVLCIDGERNNAYKQNKNLEKNYFMLVT